MTNCKVCGKTPAVILIKSRLLCASCALEAHHPGVLGRDTPAEEKIRKAKTIELIRKEPWRTYRK
jgi:hypothetical protein